MMPQPLPFLARIQPYHSTANKLVVEGDKIRLSQNEGAFGASPKAMAAAMAATAQLHLYPNTSYSGLRQALAKHHQLNPEQIVCGGGGSNELIALLIQAFAGEGDEVLHSQYSFSMYAIASRSVGATPVAVPEPDLQTDLPAMLAAITPRTKLVFLANPNNPTGSWLTRQQVEGFIKALPPHIVLVYDTAYADCMEDADYADGFAWVQHHPNVCILRTFSKLHGLAALRVGWAYGAPVVVDALNRLRNPFNLSLVGEQAAIASIEDTAFIASCRSHILLWRDKLFQQLQQLGLHPYPSKANFILTRLASPAQAQALFTYLKDQHHILVRQMAGYGLADCLRITIGRAGEMSALFQALHAFEDFRNVTPQASAVS